MSDGRPDAPLPGRLVSACEGLRREPRLPVLLVLHQQHSNPGHVGHWLRRNGYALDIRRHFQGDPLPGTLAHHAGAIVFGGPQSANDATDYIRREIAWIDVALSERKPFLGICLGAQMLAHHLGARVDHCPRGTVEVGYHPIRPTAAGDRLHFPERVYQWHREGFDLPRGGVLLATGDGAYPNQVFRYGAAIGVQFHPEITYMQVNRWTGSSTIRLLMRGARPRVDHIDSHLVEAPRVHRWLDRFMRRWIEGELAHGGGGEHVHHEEPTRRDQ
ncbi:MAG: glutamine amidotransferase [Hyphomicrobiaceae bacterium]